MIERLRAVLFPLFVSVFAKEEIVTPTLKRSRPFPRATTAVTRRGHLLPGVCLLVAILVSFFSPSTVRAQKADLSRLVVVGDSLSAGFQNGSLLDSQQVHGYANLVAQQAGANLRLPLIAPPGIPNVLTLVSPGPPPIIVPAPGTSAGRENPFLQTFDLAVPGANLHDALFARPNFPIDDLTDLILGLPGLLAVPPVSLSQVEWAGALQPTTVVVWMGNNDALGAVVNADPSLLTPVAQFQRDYHALMEQLTASGATVVVANIPGVTVVPFLTSAQEVAAEVGLPLSVIGPILGIGPGDFVTPDAFPLIVAILSNPLLGPLPNSVVLRAAQIAQIQEAVGAYNAAIAAEASAHGAALVDIHESLSRIQSDGLVVNGQRLTAGFLGGVFSLDGVHPTNTGYAVVGNEFIKALNRDFAAGVPPVSVALVAQSDPLVLRGVGHPASALGHIDPAMVKSLRQVLGH